MEKFFYLEESPYYANKYVIRMNHEKFLFPTGTIGSYNVFVSRVLNLTYAEYLRYARDRLGAELIGKKSRYVMAYFPNTEAVHEFIKLLNKRMEYVMNIYQHPFEYKEDEAGNLIKVPLLKSTDEGN